MVDQAQVRQGGVGAELTRRMLEHFSIDYRSLAAFRIMASLTLLFVCSIYAQDLNAFFATDGVLSVDQLNRYFPNHRFTILEFFDQPAIVWLLWGVLVLASLSLLVGYRARVAAAVAFVVYLSFVGRNPLITQGGDVLLPLLLFWAIFLPTGRAFGIDGALEKDRNLFDDPRIRSVATIGMLLQVLYVYVFGALLKTGQYWIPSGEAVLIALHLDSFATSAAHILRDFPVLTLLLTYFVFYLELYAPVLLFFPDKNMRVRTVSLGALMLMHLGFRIFLNIGHFWLASLSSLTTYIPSKVWDGISKRYWRAEQRQIRIYYDRDCGFCLKTCLLLREFFLPHDVAISPAQDDAEIGALLERENSWVVVTPDGEKRLHWAGLLYVTKQSFMMRPFWLVLWLVDKLGLGRATYDVIGGNRRHLSRVTKRVLALRKRPADPYVAREIALAVIVVICFAWNMDQNLPAKERAGWMKPMVPTLAVTGMTQRWGMFAPYPAFSDGYPIVSVKDPAGQLYYAQPDGSFKAELVHPERLADYYQTYRQRKYLNRIARYQGERREAMFENYARLQCANLAAHAADLPFMPESLAVDWASNRSFRQKEDEYTITRMGEWQCSSAG